MNAESVQSRRNASFIRSLSTDGATLEYSVYKAAYTPQTCYYITYSYTSVVHTDQIVSQVADELTKEHLSSLSFRK